MKRLALIMLLLAPAGVNAESTQQEGRIIGDADNGKTLATSKTCVACHGTDGVSMIPANPSLAGQHENYLAKQLHEFKLGMTSGGTEGRVNAVMGGMSIGLTDQDIADLAAYYAGLTAPYGETVESAVDLGQQLYFAGNIDKGLAACTACHGPRGNGTPSSGFPRISGQPAEYIEAQLTAFRSGERDNDLNGMMRSVALKLSDEEIKALSQYLGGLH
uniref:c-type cytochrome n=1 Tax=Thaumasiovibrio occultus TaxID=1891184 RepID=UPI000B3616D0|nr:c-type cytochrome [Thaumasiovibrio occultus]